MATLNIGMKIDSTVFQSTTSTSLTLTVPAGKVFKGRFSAFNSGAASFTALVRASALGTIYFGESVTGSFFNTNVELGAGTYFFTAPISGAGSTLAILGAIYANTQ